MFSADTHLALARELHDSERSRRQVGHFSRRFREMEIEDSYAIQRAWMDIKLAEGRTVIGHKIGLTSRAMQLASQITEPDYGTLLDDMLVQDGATLEAAKFIVPRLEVEFAFILGRPLRGPGVTVFDVLDATRYVVPALGLIDARIEQVDPETKAPRKVLDTIADNAANAAIILGNRPVKPDAFDLRWAGALLIKNGVVEETERDFLRNDEAGEVAEVLAVGGEHRELFLTPPEHRHRVPVPPEQDRQRRAPATETEDGDVHGEGRIPLVGKLAVRGWRRTG